VEVEQKIRQRNQIISSAQSFVVESIVATKSNISSEATLMRLDMASFLIDKCAAKAEVD
jgi:hypothetical protein